MFSNQPKIKKTNKKLTNNQAIVKIEFYLSQIQAINLSIQKFVILNLKNKNHGVLTWDIIRLLTSRWNSQKNLGRKVRFQLLGQQYLEKIPLIGPNRPDGKGYSQNQAENEIRITSWNMHNINMFENRESDQNLWIVKERKQQAIGNSRQDIWQMIKTCQEIPQEEKVYRMRLGLPDKSGQLKMHRSQITFRIDKTYSKSWKNKGRINCKCTKCEQNSVIKLQKNTICLKKQSCRNIIKLECF
ncbi:unnamed protein product [Paramecium sonneborni]|uniref:Uncharacterized protein n=1 Tax=Paramecium sonneborni TaxID=65129 RepID=A0A8S1PUV7_9CILI|nr:unnamed protein product [Paramecium sonneborni]